MVKLVKSGALWIALSTLMFTAYEVVLKFIAGQLNSMQLSLCRFTVGFVILLPLALRTLRRRGERLTGRDMAFFALLGLLGIALSMPILHVSVNYAGSSVAALLFSCNPVFVTFLAFFLLREPILPRHIAALVLEILGTVAIINPLHTAVDPLGTALALLSTLLFSVYGVLGKRRCERYGGAVVTCFSFLFGSLILLGMILLSHLPALARLLTGAGLGEFADIPILAGYTWENLPYVLFVSVGVAGVGFCCYFLAMERQPASVVSLVYFFKPALAPVLAWLGHGEAISANMLLGIVLIGAGSLCAILPGIREARRAPVPR